MLQYFPVILLSLNAVIEALPVVEQSDPPLPLSLSSARVPTRSLFNIVWSCLITTFLCAWVSMHPRVPNFKGGNWERAGRKFGMFILHIFAPEYEISFALEFRNASKATKTKFEEKGFRITMTHAYFLNMGGFALCFPEKEVREALGMDNKVRQRLVTETNSREVRESSRDSEEEKEAQKGSLADERIDELRFIETLSTDRFMQLLDDGAIEFPVISKDEIKDRSKGDVVAKFLIAVQVLWFVVQGIVRGIRRLAITQLEITTLALACQNAYHLVLSHGKPQDVVVPIPVYLLEESDEWEKWKGLWDERKKTWNRRKAIAFEQERRRREAEEKMPPSWQKFLLSLWNSVPAGLCSRKNWWRFLGRPRLTADRIRREIMNPTILRMVLELPLGIVFRGAIVGVTFGALHTVGWYLTFPSKAKQETWRILSILLAVLPILYPFLVASHPRPSEAVVIRIIAFGASTIFVFARISMLILAVTLLWDQPPTAYLAIR